jgi:hypothetical protein
MPCFFKLVRVFWISSEVIEVMLNFLFIFHHRGHSAAEPQPKTISHRGHRDHRAKNKTLKTKRLSESSFIPLHRLRGRGEGEGE